MTLSVLSSAHCKPKLQSYVCCSLIYAVGGQGSNELLDVVECYNPAVNEWRVVSPLPRKLESLTAVSYRGKMYCFGGATGSEIMNSAYR